VERILEQLGYTPGALSAAGAALNAAIEPHSDHFASGSYRRSATVALLGRTLAQSCGALPPAA
ncbi:MAG: hypothetical protein Q7T63_01715, partial [Burkholderiaceae bacterium]|nr:hypothetical protein [Burkholderiaceae bacterium]